VTKDAQRTMNTFLGACRELGPEDIDEAQIARSRVVYMEGYLWDPPAAKQAFLKACKIARAAGRKTTRAAGDPLIFHRGPSTGNQIQPAAGRLFPRSERVRMEMEADAGIPVWTGAVLDRNGTKTAVPVTTSERTDAATGQRWFVADVTLAPLGPGDYVVELSTTKGSDTHKSLVAIRVTQ